jgi:hypothetical protein
MDAVTVLLVTIYQPEYSPCTLGLSLCTLKYLSQYMNTLCIHLKNTSKFRSVTAIETSVLDHGAVWKKAEISKCDPVLIYFPFYIPCTLHSQLFNNNDAYNIYKFALFI